MVMIKLFNFFPIVISYIDSEIHTGLTVINELFEVETFIKVHEID